MYHLIMSQPFSYITYSMHTTELTHELVLLLSTYSQAHSDSALAALEGNRTISEVRIRRGVGEYVSSCWMW